MHTSLDSKKLSVPDKDKCVLLEKTYVIKKRFGWSLVDCDDPDTTGVALCVVEQGTFKHLHFSTKIIFWFCRRFHSAAGTDRNWPRTVQNRLDSIHNGVHIFMGGQEGSLKIFQQKFCDTNFVDFCDVFFFF